jgi:nuclear pore complex protein Nup133
LLTLAALDDELDLIAVQDALRDSLLSVTPPLRSTQTPLEAYVAAHLTNLRDRPAFRQLFVSLAQRVVAGEALEIEDLVDVLTLKDNRAEEGGDGAVALDRLVRDSVRRQPGAVDKAGQADRSQELPEGRKQVALLSVWRRVFVRDE